MPSNITGPIGGDIPDLEHVDGWTDDTRSDGMTVAKSVNGTWVALSPHRSVAPILGCPCCRKAFQTAKAAKLVANYTYPLPKA